MLLAQVVMVHPVIATDGHTHQRGAVKHWLRWHDTSPVTGATLAHENPLCLHLPLQITASSDSRQALPQTFRVQNSDAVLDA